MWLIMLMAKQWAFGRFFDREKFKLKIKLKIKSAFSYNILWARSKATTALLLQPRPNAT